MLPLLNGIDAPDVLAAAVGREHVLGGLCRIVALKAGPGRIRHAGITPDVELGELDGGRSERVERLRAAFAGAGVEVRVPPDIRVAMWRKFLFIAALSGVGAATGAPVGVLRSVAPTRELLVAALEETAALARAVGVALPADSVAATLAFIDGLPAAATASMQRDLLEGRPSELEAQSGTVARKAREAGVAAPVHDALYRLLLPRELRARGEVEF